MNQHPSTNKNTLKLDINNTPSELDFNFSLCHGYYWCCGY